MTIEFHPNALEARVNSLVDERLFAAFWDSTKHYGTKDLVLFFNENEEIEPVSATPRQSFLSAPDVPEVLRTKRYKPAVDAAIQLTAADTAFWLLVLFLDGKMACTAINAKPIAPGGTA